MFGLKDTIIVDNDFNALEDENNMVGVICQYRYWQIRNYLPVPVLANKKLFASTSWLCITQGAEGIKRRNEKAVLAVGKGLVRIYRREGYLQIPTSIFLQVLYFQLRNYMQVLLCYNSRQIKLLTLSKTDQLEAGDYKVHICGSEGGGNTCQKSQLNSIQPQLQVGFTWKLLCTHPTMTTQEHRFGEMIRQCKLTQS